MTLLNKIIPLALFFTQACIGSKKSSYDPITTNEIEKNIAKVNDSLYVGRFEVTNGEFAKFLNYVKAGNRSELFKNYRSDSTLWYNHPTEAMSGYYHRHPSYVAFPVVGVSYEAATAYCEWLTQQYMSRKKRIFQKVIFRLPTEAEWVEAAYGGDHSLRYPWGNYLIRQTGEFMARYRKTSDQRITFDTISKTYKVVISQAEIDNWDAIPVPVGTFWPNKFGIYHQSGNVAEMVSEKGLTKGGSYNDPGYDIQITSRKFYAGPSVEVGFRVAMQILR